MLNRAVQFLIQMAMRLRFAIIPVNPDKRPQVPWKQYQQVRPSDEQVELWSRASPPAWAIITGDVSGVIVLDFDGEQGNATMHALGLEPHVRTGSGGHHVYFMHPGWPVATVNGKAKRDLGAKFPGVDIRGDGGYAIFAGRANSDEYVWLRDMVPDSLDILPDEVRAAFGLLAPPSPSSEDASSDSRSDKTREAWAAKVLGLALSRVSLHGRNNVCFWLACQLRDNGYSEEDAVAVIAEYACRVPSSNAKGQSEPFTLDEARNSVRQAFSRPPRQPWNSFDQFGGAFTTPLPTIEISNRELRDLSRDAMVSAPVQ